MSGVVVKLQTSDGRIEWASRVSLTNSPEMMGSLLGQMWKPNGRRWANALLDRWRPLKVDKFILQKH